ncbi:MAG TPA: biotin--[acetyl-CoA-carboxylase] ligase [Legionella sp.]|nr:biotin--[acetyl-CoA-carboxylase] ligase [Legionella sp.]
MVKFNDSNSALLNILCDAHCHSGSELGLVLGISRSAVWKQINQLISIGIPINRIPHKGYQLIKPIILLDRQKIAEDLYGLKTPYTIHLYPTIDSTNRFLKDLPVSDRLEICCAESQTQGRGRFGRHWHSPFGENIYVSAKWNFNCDLSRLSGLSLITSLAVLTTLKEFIDTTLIKVKWPNDILWGDKKICGSLIEVVAESNSTAQVIVGIGLNVNSDPEIDHLKDILWGSMYEISNSLYNRNLIIARLIINLEGYITRFINEGFDAFVEEWNRSDYLQGKSITVTQTLNTFTGIAHGINSQGQLIIEDSEGVNHLLSSGDTSLKKGKTDF